MRWNLDQKPGYSLVLVTILCTSGGCGLPESAESASPLDEMAPASSRSDASGAAEGRPRIVPISDTAVGRKNPVQGDRAFGYLQRICQIGPRPTGSRGMATQLELVVKHFRELGGQVRLQKFRIRHPRSGEPVTAANVIVQWHPERVDRILLCAHYDTRPQPDNPKVSLRERGNVFIGANDGASGVAAFMELAHFMPSLPSRYGVDFLLVDAEEFVFPDVRRQRYFLGSEFFARDYVTNRPKYRYRKAAVLDMIGDRDLQIYQDRNSVWWRDTRPITKEIWATARRLGVNEFISRTHPRMSTPIRDDHLMLHDIGKIPTCEIIDFDYPRFPTNRYWHTDQDAPDKCSGQSLAKVAWVMLEWMRTAE